MILTSSQQQAVLSFYNELKKGKTKTEAADQVGVSRSTLARWLTAENAPQPPKAKEAKPKAPKRAKPTAEAKAARTKKAKKAKETPVVQAPVVETKKPVNSEMYDKLAKVVAEQLGVSEGDVHLNAKFVEDLGADSLDLVEIVMAVEDEFEIEIDDAEAEAITDVQGAYDLVISKQIENENQLVVEPLANGNIEELAPLAAVELTKGEPEEEPDVLVPFQSISLPTTLMVVREGKPCQIDKSHKNYEKIQQLASNTVNGQIYSRDLAKLLDLIDMKGALSRWSNGRVTVSKEGGVQVDGKRLNGKLADVMMRCLSEDDEKGLERFSKFHDKISQSMSFKVNTRLFEFVTKTGLRIDGDGDIVALKVVRNNYLDKHSGTFDNRPGKVVEMPRVLVDDDDTRTCSTGLHICSPGYISHFSSRSGGDRLIEVKVDPRDIVSVPTDYNFDKCRCCKYIVLGDVSAAYKKELYNT